MRPGRVARNGGNGERLQRAAVVRAWDHGDNLTVIGGDGALRCFQDDSAAMARVVMELCATARTRAEIVAELARLAEVAVADVPGEVVDELLGHLREAGVLVAGAAPGVVAERRRGVRGRVVLGITGAVAACDAPQLCRALLARGHTVRVAMTRAARRFVAVDALRAITHGPVHTSMWTRDERVPHVNLAEWADVVLVAPASARTLARLATGDFGDLVSAVALGTRAPVIVAPSMNVAMLQAPAVRRNLAQLRDDGLHVVHGALGIEVAHAPEARRAMLGPAPPAAALVDIVDQILATALEGRALATPDDWERAWASTPAHAQPWHTEALDDDVGAALDGAGAGAGRRFLDLGAGAGTAALGAAARGFEVVAMDVSPSALAAGRERAAGAPVTWVLDDATRPRLWGRFDVLLDRGLLHVLPEDRRGDYAVALARLAAPGALLLIKTHTPEAAPALRTQPPAPDELRALLGGAFELTDMKPSTFPGPSGTPPALLYSLRRRAATT